MRILLRALSLILGLCLLLATTGVQGKLAQARPFENEEAAREAVRLETLIRDKLPGGGDTESYRRNGDEFLKNGAAREAVEAFKALVVLDKNDGAAWIAFARALLAVQTSDPNEKWSLPQSAGGAAYLGWRRSALPERKAEALAVLAESFSVRQSWRPALDAYKASLALRDEPTIRTAHDKLLAEHGFRMLDYTVDFEAASPRLCVQFSEPLAKGSIDFAKFVSVNNEDPAAVKSEGQQLCVEELAHGRRYEIKIRSGLPSVVDEVLAKNVELTVHVRDRKPMVRFLSRNYVLPNTAQQGLPVVSVNTETVKAELYRIGDRRLVNEVMEGQFGEQIGGAKIRQLKESQGEKLWSGAVNVRMALNEEVTSAFPIDELRPNLKPGLYVMAAWTGEQGSADGDAAATQWFVVSDLGLSALSGADGVHVFVRSLAKAVALPGVEVRLIAKNNEVLGEAKSGPDGQAHFEGGLSLGVGGLAPALVVVRDEEGDYGFLDLTKSAFDLSDRGVGGRPSPGPLDAMVFAERGVYRAGEDVYLTALLRDAAGKAVAGAPLTLKVFRPDGVERDRRLTEDAGNGGRSLKLSLDPAAMQGSWRVSAHVDPKGPAIGETMFHVMEYDPERLEMTIAPKTTSLEQGQTGLIAVAGRYLYGAPAAGLTIEGEIDVAARKNGFPGFAAYRFGLEQEELATLRRPLEDAPKTGADGRAEVKVGLPPLPTVTRPLAANVTVRLLEPGGRPLERSVETPVRSSKPFIGVKPLFEGGHSSEDQPAAFEVVAVDGDGRRIALSGLKWRLDSVHNRFQWYFRDGRWNHELITYTSRVAEGALDVGADGPKSLTVPVKQGAYRLEILSSAPREAATSVSFQAGWYASEASDTPDILDLALDKAAYRAGDEVKVHVLPRMAGEAVVAVVSDRVLHSQTISVSEDGGAASFTVGENWGPGAYVTVMLFRPMDAGAKRAPGRAIGVKWLPIDATARTLRVALDAPEVSRPNQRLDVKLTVSGLAEGERAQMIVAAVDAGVLNLTGFGAPDPASHYFGQRRLGGELRDLYGKLIDGMQGARGVIRSGGDIPSSAGAAGRSLGARPVALYSGILESGHDGKAEASFELPQFDGTLRLMAIAWNGEQVGQGVKDVNIRDPLVIIATPPKFLHLGDSSQMQVSLQNVSGGEGEYGFAVLSEGGVIVGEAGSERKLWLKPDARADLTSTLKADRLGASAVRLVVTGPNGLTIERRYALAVEPAAPKVMRRSVLTLAAREGSLTVNSDLIADLVPETAKVAVSAGAGAYLDVPGLLLALDRYPYDCAEQTTSRALPLLYYSELAGSAELPGGKGAKERVGKAIERLANLQGSNGSFGLWEAGGYDLWLTAYVTDFLLRAREQGFAVRPLVTDGALDRLKNFINLASNEIEGGGEALAYALYVLARAGRAVVGDLRYYADEKIGSFVTPMAQAQIGAALAMLGDKERAEKVFAKALGGVVAETSPSASSGRAGYGSELRDDAAVLTLVSESRASSSGMSQAIDAVRKLRAARPATNTQESAWLLLAARGLADDSRALSFEVNGNTAQGPVQEALGAENLEFRPFELRNLSDAPVIATVSVTGASAMPEPEAAAGFAIERKFYTPEGQELRLEDVRQNSRVVVAIKVIEAEARPGHIIVEDRVPAGFEIEKPSLRKRADMRADLKAFPWLPSDTTLPEFTSFRDDGVAAAFSFEDASRTKPAVLTLAYVMRAVLPGEYVHPGAGVEDMYRPERFARTAAGKVKILRAE